MKHLLAFLNDSKSIDEYSTEELKCFPIRFFENYVEPATLLNIWGKLPIEYRTNADLQLCLPCFVHYNRPSIRTHVDGPPSSQSKCRLCIRVLTMRF